MTRKAHILLTGHRPDHRFDWEVTVANVTCRPDREYTTASAAKRAAIRWCERLGLSYEMEVSISGSPVRGWEAQW